MDCLEQIRRQLSLVYPGCYEDVYRNVAALLEKWKQKQFPSYPWIDNGDVLLIAYGDAVRRKGEAVLIYNNRATM
jgi:sucrose phosphorylase